MREAAGVFQLGGRVAGAGSGVWRHLKLRSVQAAQLSRTQAPLEVLELMLQYSREQQSSMQDQEQTVKKIQIRQGLPPQGVEKRFRHIVYHSIGLFSMA